MEFVVGLCDCFFDGVGQRGQVVPVREISGLDWWQDSDLGVTWVEELGSRCRYAIGAFNDDRKDGKSDVDGDAKRSLLEGEQLMSFTPRTLREHDQGMAAFGCEIDTIDDRLPAGASRLTINFDDADSAHGRRDEGDPEQLFLRKKPAVDWQNGEKQRNVECREVIGNNDIAFMWLNVFHAFDGEMHWRYAQKCPCPAPHDPPKHRCSWPKDAVHDDERGVRKREQEKQRNEDERTGSCGQRLRHVGSVDEMEKVAR